MKQFTKKQAISFYDSKEWENWDNEQIVKLQLFQNKLCVPFSVFHKAIEKVLDRPVWSHEFAWRKKLIEEYFGVRDSPTFDEIMDLIPEEKRVIIGI